MKIAIIGGGITGLTTALSLQKLGIKSTVYERADPIEEIGAGIWLQPNAMQIIRWLGIEDRIKSEGCILNKMEIAYPDLKPVRKINREVVSDKFGNQTVAIHRGKLQRILYEELKKTNSVVHQGMEYRSHQVINDKVEIEFSMANVTADIVLGADGIRSGVRDSLGFPSIYRNSGQMCWRGIARVELPVHLKKGGKEIWGRKVRFGFSEIADNTVYFFIVANNDVAPQDDTPEELSKLFSDFDPWISRIIHSSQRMHKTELLDLKRLDKWSHSKVCLMGDAAHAATPNMGQGACQGMEDAYVMSHLLQDASSSPEEIFRIFEAKRRRKVDYVVNNSWRFGQMAHNTWGQKMLKFVMKVTPETIFNKQMNSLFTLDSF